jgi:hypothetical protein
MENKDRNGGMQMKAQVKAWWIGESKSQHENSCDCHALACGDEYEDVDDMDIEEAARCLVECAFNEDEPIKKVNHVAIQVDDENPYIVKVTAKIGESLEFEIVKRDASATDLTDVW